MSHAQSEVYSWSHLLNLRCTGLWIHPHYLHYTDSILTIRYNLNVKTKTPTFNNLYLCSLLMKVTDPGDDTYLSKGISIEYLLLISSRISFFTSPTVIPLPRIQSHKNFVGWNKNTNSINSTVKNVYYFHKLVTWFPTLHTNILLYWSWHDTSKLNASLSTGMSTGPLQCSVLCLPSNYLSLNRMM